MKTMISGAGPRPQYRFLSIAAGLMLCGSYLGLADLVQMRNGDQYFGSVLSLNKDTLIIQSDVLGTVRLPRDKVAFVDFGAGPVGHNVAVVPATNTTAHPPTLAVTNRTADSATALLGSEGTSNALKQIEAQYLSEAGPEAKAKFNELLGGYLSGKLSVSDIRAQAQSTAEQVRSLRKDLGEDAGGVIDGYLAILDSFLKETAPPPGPASNTPSPRPLKPKPGAPEEE